MASPAGWPRWRATSPRRSISAASTWWSATRPTSIPARRRGCRPRFAISSLTWHSSRPAAATRCWRGCSASARACVRGCRWWWRSAPASSTRLPGTPPRPTSRSPACIATTPACRGCWCCGGRRQVRSADGPRRRSPTTDYRPPAAGRRGRRVPMDKFHISGPTPLVGRVCASGAKNAALPALAASLLTDEPVTLYRVPRVRDLRTMRRLLDYLGVGSEEREARAAAGDAAAPASPDRPESLASPDSLASRPETALVLQRARPSSSTDAPYELVKTMRASVLVLGPLVARFGFARVSLPGGCAIGVRPIDQHLKGLAALGADIRLAGGYVETRANRLAGARFRFDLPTVTGTENLLLAACLARGTTVLENCAREPEVADLATLLNAMGARISGAGGDTVVVDGVDGLGGAAHRVIPDRIEGGTYLIGAAITGGDVLLEQASAADLAPLLDKMAEVGVEIEVSPAGIRARARGGDGSLRARDVATAPHPGFP